MIAFQVSQLLKSSMNFFPITFANIHTHTTSRILSPKGYAEAQPWHPLFAKCVPSHDVIGGEPIAISGTNSRLRADTEQKNPNITLPDPGFEPRTSECCRTAHAVQLRHRGSC
ncbi:hypothetical protein O3G_MSEX006022 [Manduca sexta]|uniref:Uncharacterized protein n=1 Tax=Manduca sexta TaxID=7130 RepID=A0A921Z0S0_MANSE|nr:hypothetical protein O3G_MSEX006022 [Manduca sexta]